MRMIHEDEMADYQDQMAEERYGRRRLPRYVSPHDPGYEAPEAFCFNCGYTTNFNSRGECSDCGEDVR